MNTKKDILINTVNGFYNSERIKLIELYRDPNFSAIEKTRLADFALRLKPNARAVIVPMLKEVFGTEHSETLWYETAEKLPEINYVFAGREAKNAAMKANCQSLKSWGNRLYVILSQSLNTRL